MAIEQFRSEVHLLCLQTLKPSNDFHGYEALGIPLLLAEDVKGGTGAQSQSESCRSLTASLPYFYPYLLQGVLLQFFCALMGGWSYSSLAPRPVPRCV